MHSPRNLDHIVVATRDLATTVKTFTKATGLEPVLGGVHPDQGTRNFLAAFPDGGYLEIIGIDEDRPGPRIFDLHLISEPKVATFAVHPEGPEGKLGHASALGFELGELYDGQRRDPSGNLLRWRLTRPLFSDHSGASPFVIDWGDTPSPAETTQVQVELDEFRVAHPDPSKIKALYDALDVDVFVEEGPAVSLAITVSGPSGQWTIR